METLIMHPQNKEQLIALKAIAKALKVPFYNTKEEELSEREKGIKLYGKDLVEKIERGEKAIQKGEFITLDPEKSLWENIL
jgi:hypothetical protein